ncbi:peroxisomal membrane protein 4 [Xylona heveae TC161]|uniref:Peroxisomal membrane protein 4 n=1 Tax=Xylona heveae (strain CBS 132557 / TC161) TaxID=1328760 RepID=A0A165HPV1_XYLHT|nr:peroxisomal membrane protein 4 [Xylona heveae TC161]KZF23814.1 peroxisomal membrane protein 4 [Xylona heveae TC161]
MDGLKDAVDRIILDPKYADLLAVVKAARNGAVYGAKIRFPHALVMVFLFRSGTVRERLRLVLKATRQHARNLAKFAAIYKFSLIVLRQLSLFNDRTTPGGKPDEARYDTFIAGLIGGYYVFGRGIQSSVNQQIVIYVFARVVLALAKLAVMKMPALSGGMSRTTSAGGSAGGAGSTANPLDLGTAITKHSWPVFASLSWAFVMYIFRWHPDAVQPSLRSSMKYIYVNADYWDSFKNFLIYNK